MAGWPRALLAVGPTLLGLSGLLLIAAARERWVGVCPFWGDHDTGACLARQDHAYDFMAPTEPWVPVGDAATLAGAAFLVLGLAAVVVPAVMLGIGQAVQRTWHRTAVMVICAPVLSVGALGVGWGTLVSARAGRALEPWPAPLYGIFWAIGWPAALVTLAVVVAARGGAGDGWRSVAAVLLAGSTPFAMLVLGPAMVGYTSYDTAPWTEASAGVLLVLAAFALRRGGARASRAARSTEAPEAEPTRVSQTA